ncbi:MAG TPA: protein phosphatase 2C domain-containing protein [Gemmatimonadales bacterium]|nr:protein phosphatase 2C domain-containing protein [Gemmatimonadales bacterium]
MTSTSLRSGRITSEPGAKPRDDELDLFGLTHAGKVRPENQDHFLLCTVHPQAVIHATSLPDPEKLSARGQRLATVMLVADGVGGSAAGREASQLAAETIMRYVTSTLRSYPAMGSQNDEEFLSALRTAALEADATVRTAAAERAQATGRLSSKSMATTLTLALAVWPWLYVVQVGDSRCYFFWNGDLQQVTRDQTMAQDLVDKGALPADRAAQSPFSHVLASSIGGPETVPEVTRIDVTKRGCVILLCTDGLTKHVSDPEIAAQLGAMQSAEQVCHALLDLALERGGSDNITVLAARAPLKKS